MSEGFDVEKWQKDRIEKQYKGAMALEGFRKYMYEEGFKYIVVHYEGAGDSGEAYSMEGYKDRNDVRIAESEHYGGEYIKFKDYHPENGGDPVQIPEEDAYKKGTRNQYSVWKSLVKFNKLTKSSIDQYTLVDLIDYDWYNNEGGQGYLIFDLRDGTIKVEGQQNYHECREVRQTLHTDGKESEYSHQSV